MNKLIKMPLFLGITCLVCGGLLSCAVALTNPTIEKNEQERLSKAFREMYQDETALVTKTTAIEDNDTLTEVNDVTHDGNLQSAVYLVNSVSGYERMQFYLGISRDTNLVDGYYYLSSNNQSLGVGNFSNNDNVSDLYNGYDGSTSIVIAGTTVTSKAVKSAVDAALKDYNYRYLGIGGSDTGDETPIYETMYGEGTSLIKDRDIEDKLADKGNDVIATNAKLVTSQDGRAHFIYTFEALINDDHIYRFALGFSGFDFTYEIDAYQFIGAVNDEIPEYVALSDDEYVLGQIEGKTYTGNLSLDFLEPYGSENVIKYAFMEAIKDMTNADWNFDYANAGKGNYVENIYGDNDMKQMKTITLEGRTLNGTDDAIVTKAEVYQDKDGLNHLVYLVNSLASGYRYDFYIGFSFQAKENNDVTYYQAALDGYSYLNAYNKSTDLYKVLIDNENVNNQVKGKGYLQEFTLEGINNGGDVIYRGFVAAMKHFATENWGDLTFLPDAE